MTPMMENEGMGMETRVKTQEELDEAMQSHQDSIIIEGDLAQKDIRIKATGKTAWIIAIGALLVAILALSFSFYSAKMTTFAVGIGAEGVSAQNDSIFNLSIYALLIAILAGIIGVLNRFKRYKIQKISDREIKLTR